MDKGIVRVGVIGVGNMGSAHAAAIFHHKVSGLQLAGVCDICASRKSWCETQLGDTPFFTDYDTMLRQAGLDAVVIATPHRYHPPMAIQAFEAGLHVLIEKPAGVSACAVRQMNEVAEASERVFAIMWNQRTSPLYQKVREIVQTGQLGAPKRLVWNITNWYRSQAYYDSGDWRATWAGEGGGVLLNQAPHNLDLWQWIFGMPARLRAFCYCGKYHHIEVEDDATIFAEYANGATAVFITSTGEYPGVNRLEIAGDRGHLIAEGGILKWWKISAPERELCFSETAGFPSWSTSYEEFDLRAGESGHIGILQNFSDAIRCGAPLLAPGTDGALEMLLSNAAYLSAWTDNWVDFPFSEEQFDTLLQEKQKHSVFKTRHIHESQAMNGCYQNRWSIQW